MKAYVHHKTAVGIETPGSLTTRYSAFCSCGWSTTFTYTTKRQSIAVGTRHRRDASVTLQNKGGFDE